MAVYQRPCRGRRRRIDQSWFRKESTFAERPEVSQGAPLRAKTLAEFKN